jgi:hypothetical protein
MVAITTPSVLDTRTGPRPIAPSATATATPTPSPTPTVPTYQDLNRRAVEVLLQRFPDTQRFVPTGPTGPFSNSKGRISAQTRKGQSRNGDSAVTIDLGVMYLEPSVPSPDTDPCVVKPGDTAGRQGAPRRDDVCNSVPQPDGSRVWLRRTTQPAVAEYEESKLVMVTQLRPGNLYVELTVAYWTLSQTFYDEATIIAAITDPRIGALPQGTKVIDGAID